MYPGSQNKPGSTNTTFSFGCRSRTPVRMYQARVSAIAKPGIEVKMQLPLVLLVLNDTAGRTGVDDLLPRLRVRALLGEPVLVVVHHIMHRRARGPGHASQGQVLEDATVSA